MKFNKLFGNNISPSCEYCENRINPYSDKISCNFSKKAASNYSCSKFIYAPLLRKPSKLQKMPKYSKDDFKI